MTGLIPMLAATLYVFLRAFQTRNITEGRYGVTVPFSYAIDFVGFYIIAQIAEQGYDLALLVWIGTGSALGTLLAMAIHKKVFNDTTD